MQAVIQSERVTFAKMITALFFVGTTIQYISVIKKIIPLHYEDHPYQLFELIQRITEVLLLYFGREMDILQFPSLDRKTVSCIYPIMIFYCGTIATAPEAFGIVNNSLFSLSRHFVILITITIVFERTILDVHISNLVKFTIATMVLGAICGTPNERIADYCVILLNFSFAVGNRVYFKKILDSRQLGVSGLMYYSTIIMLIPGLILAFYIDMWNNIIVSINVDTQFWFQLLLTMVIGTMISCSSIMCIKYNGVLTTSILGGLVNTIITFLSYYEYLKENDEESNEFSWNNCVGWTVIVLASLIYICVIFKPDSASNNALVSKDEII